MSTLFPRTISYKHRTAELVNGVWEFSETDGTFTGSVQPLTGKELQFLPEGRRDIGLMKVYSNTPLSVSVEGSTGILLYETTNIKIGTNRMVLSFEGRGLGVRCVSGSCVEITGYVTKIEFVS